MRSRHDAATPVALLVAAALALPMGLAVAQLSVPVALAVGAVAAVLVVAVSSNELALYLLVGSMLLGPQVLVGELGQGATLGRGLTLRLDDVLIVIVGLAWLAKTGLHKEFGLVFRTPLNRPIAAFSCAAVFATGLGMIVGRVSLLGGLFFVLKYIQYFVIYFMVVNNLRSRRQCERFLVALLLTAAIVSVVGILQIPSGQRVSAPFEGSRSGEPNTFGGYLVLMLAVVAGLLLTARTLGHKALLAGLGLLLVVPFLFTLSRASYLALIPLAVALFLWSDRRTFVAGLLASSAALAPLLLPAPVADRIAFTFSQPFHPDQVQIVGLRLDTSTSDRLGSWREAVLRDWPRQPIFGYGVTGYRFLDAQYPRVLVETGIVGLLAFLWLQAGIFQQARRALAVARTPLYRGLALGFLAGFLALIAHSIGSNTFIIVRIMEPFWFLAGMVVMIPELEATEAVGERRPVGVAEGVGWAPAARLGAGR